LPPRPSRHSADAESAPSPLDWLAARSLIDTAAPAAQAEPATDPRGLPSGNGAGPHGQNTTDRLAQILAENRVEPSSGGRRRRRYREDGETDDVLARVLRGE
jgi:hypothetical protein